MTEPAASGTDALWAGVDRVIDRAWSLDDLQSHRLQLLAARRWRQCGRELPSRLRSQEHTATVLSLLSPYVLARARAAYDGTIVLMKGPEVGARYPDPILRPYCDLDLLVDDAPAAQRAFLAAGFTTLGEDAAYEGRHHLCPLRAPDVPLKVEVHRRIEWPKWGPPPDTEELLASAVPSAIGVDGLLALRPDHHALALAAHSWSGAPLRRILDLVDIAAVTEDLDRRAVAAIARGWGIEGVWRTMIDAADALLLEVPGARVPPWARDIRDVRDSTVFENHLARLLGPLWALPLHRGLHVAVRAVADDLRPTVGESWAVKRGRARRAVLHPTTPLAEHHAVEAQ
ncbi:MAG: putative nucleotidyltransferase, partial [Chloroflexota bacterium]|nr:putative nucleotidyltransferase [Chloroflexota bacterium]